MAHAGTRHGGHPARSCIGGRHSDIGSIDVLSDIAREAGLDAAEFRPALESGKYREQRQQALKQAHLLGISAVPTMFIGHRRLQGLHPADALASAIDHELRAEKIAHQA
ncbi:MAG: DsbA family protein [Terriglobales bacterium]